jgi:hypothetical protein
LENLKLKRLNATLKPLAYDYEEATTSVKSSSKSKNGIDKKKSRSTRKRWESTSSEEEHETHQVFHIFTDFLSKSIFIAHINFGKIFGTRGGRE